MIVPWFIESIVNSGWFILFFVFLCSGLASRSYCLLKKNLGHGPLSYTPPWEGMFLLCLLPKIQILCDVPEFLYLCELQRYDIVFLVHVRWNYIKNVSCFLQKKFVCKHFAYPLWWHNELSASIITYYVRISNDMWTYTWSIHTFIAQNMIDV
jgi:hypothetical protein